jgi:hypothetical protein
MPWFRESFKLSDIIYADYFIGGRGADGIKLIFSNYKTKNYRSYLLNYGMFSELENRINAADDDS